MEATVAKRKPKDFVDVIDVLRAAQRLALPDGSVRLTEVAAELGTSETTIHNKVRLLRRAGRWPYSPAVRRADAKPRPCAPPLDPDRVLAAAAKVAAQGRSPGVQTVSREMGVNKQRARDAIARLVVSNRWPYESRATTGRTCPDAELAERIASRPLPIKRNEMPDGSVVVHRNPGLHPDEVDDPKLHGVMATPRSVNAPHHKAPKSNAELVAGYVREWKAIRRRHRKAVWA